MEQKEEQARAPQICGKCHRKKIEWSQYKKKHVCSTPPCTDFEACPTKFKKGHPEAKQNSPQKISKKDINKKKQNKNKDLKANASLKPTPEWSTWVKDNNLSFDSGPKQLNTLIQEARKFIAAKTAETFEPEASFD